KIQCMWSSCTDDLIATARNQRNPFSSSEVQQIFPAGNPLPQDVKPELLLQSRGHSAERRHPMGLLRLRLSDASLPILKELSFERSSSKKQTREKGAGPREDRHAPINTTHIIFIYEFRQPS